MNDEVTAVYCDFLIDLNSSMSTLFSWVSQYLAVFINEASHDFPSGESAIDILNIGFSLFYENIVESVRFGSKQFTNDYNMIMSLINCLEPHESSKRYLRNIEGAIDASIAKMHSAGAKKVALIMFSDAYETSQPDISPRASIDVASLFITEKLAGGSNYLRSWEMMHNEAAKIATETEMPDFKVNIWDSEMFSAWDKSYAAVGGSRAYDDAKHYPMKSWVQASAYNRIKQFISVTYTLGS
ncbi:MAG: hypothetical protein FWG30_03880 [Eubacteriaceae bacterium]|nr:hypothetical protein [Eubacteriaceae bacterium]